MGPGPGRPGPGSPQVNAFCGQQGQDAADAFTENGVRALGLGHNLALQGPVGNNHSSVFRMKTADAMVPR